MKKFILLLSTMSIVVFIATGCSQSEEATATSIEPTIAKKTEQATEGVKDTIKAAKEKAVEKAEEVKAEASAKVEKVKEAAKDKVEEVKDSVEDSAKNKLKGLTQ